MTTYQSNYAQKIRNQYIPQEQTDLDKLKALDKKVKRPANVFAYTFGSISSLVLGTGMSFAMEVIGSSMLLGVGIGVLGLALCSITYPIYKAILKKRKKKYSEQIISLTEKLIEE